jgi:hypothetical protein
MLSTIFRGGSFWEELRKEVSYLKLKNEKPLLFKIDFHEPRFLPMKIKLF